MLKGGCYCGAVRYEAAGAPAEIDISTEYRESRFSGNS